MRWFSSLVTLLLLLTVVGLDLGLAGAFPRDSRLVTLMELRSGGTSMGAAHIAVRRDDFRDVLRLLGNPANPLDLTASEKAMAAERLRYLQALFEQATWAGVRLQAELTPQQLRQIRDLQEDPSLATSALRLEFRTFMQAAESTWGADLVRQPPPPEAIRRGTWSPDETPAEFREWVSVGQLPVVTLVDFEARVVAAGLLRTREPITAFQFHLCRQMLQGALEADVQWTFLHSVLQQGPGRGGSMPPPVRREEHAPDIPLSEALPHLQRAIQVLEGNP